MKNGPNSFEGRTLGVLLTDGAGADALATVSAQIERAGGAVKIVAPKIGGVTLSDGEMMPPDHKIDGGPSVLFDAVALIISSDGTQALLKHGPTRDFIADAFAHCKFIGYVEQATPLLEKARVKPALRTQNDFAQRLSALRFWERELANNPQQ